MRVPWGAPIGTAAQMRAAEEAVFASGVGQDALMERAGAAVAREAARFAIGRPVLVVAGPGNNGGDAYVAARHLRATGHDVQVAALGAPKAGSAAVMRGRWEGEVVPFAEAMPRPMLVDGLFGTGMTRALDGALAADLQRLVSGAEFTLSIDLPSGIETDSGTDFGAPRGIDATLALAALKPAHVLGAGLTLSGRTLLADIGIPCETQWRSVARPMLSPPPLDSHKYSRGLVVVIEGAMPGAGRLAARAALAGGAGYAILAGEAPERGGPDALVRRRIGDLDDLRALLAEERIRAVVFGPGLGRDRRAGDWLGAALECAHPLVLDGDALTLLGTRAAEAVKGRDAPTILTPHSGEFARMFGESGGSKIDRTLAAARAADARIVHKGADTVIADPDGRVRVLAGASSWLSTAGTGDVLAGLLGARLALGGGDPAGEAVWLHARAARLAGAGFIADDLIARLPVAIGTCL